MARLKKYTIHKEICDVCNGNGYVKITKENKEEHVHQCWECDSEGEFYAYEDNPTYGNRNTHKYLH